MSTRYNNKNINHRSFSTFYLFGLAPAFPTYKTKFMMPVLTNR